MDLSIVIINWNGLKVLRPCLDSIFGSPQELELEVIVVDNASTDGSVETLSGLFPQVVFVRNQQNLGFAAANNQAFALARGRYVLLLNNDTLLLPRALSASFRYLESHPGVGALGCRVEFPDRSFQTSCYRFSNPLVLLMTRLLPLGSVAGERLNIGRYWGRQFAEPTEVDVVAGCFLIVRSEVIAGVGGFDEDFFMYGEDEEWCSRIKQAGWRIVYFPGATIIHIHRFSSNQSRRALRLVECLSPLLVLHKRRGPVVAWVANLILLSAVLVRLPFWLVVDASHLCRGSAQKGLLGSRFLVLGAYLRGLFSPVWLPAPSRPAVTPPQPGAASALIR